MTESSGCDPQLAERARRQGVDDGLTRLLVDGEPASDWFLGAKPMPIINRDPGDETDAMDYIDAEQFLDDAAG